MKRILTLLAVVLGLSASLTACNTVRGVGQDIESTANAVDRAI